MGVRPEPVAQCALFNSMGNEQKALHLLMTAAASVDPYQPFAKSRATLHRPLSRSSNMTKPALARHAVEKSKGSSGGFDPSSCSARRQSVCFRLAIKRAHVATDLASWLATTWPSSGCSGCMCTRVSLRQRWSAAGFCLVRSFPQASRYSPAGAGWSGRGSNSRIAGSESRFRAAYRK
jgi:hypothetical protein